VGGRLLLYDAPYEGIYSIDSLASASEGERIRTQVQKPHIRKTLLPIAPTYNNHDVPNKRCSMIPPRTRSLSRRLHLLPTHRLFPRRPHHPITPWSNLQRPHIVQRGQPVPTAKYPYFAFIKYRCVGSPCGWVRPREEGGSRPASSGGVENVSGVVVHWPEPPAKHDDLLIDERGGVRSAGRWYVADCIWVRPLHRFFFFCGENISTRHKQEVRK
jgi:hypothetical protein